MRLSKIKLAGFKSFVDPTTFHIPERLLAVVGPNGCGKSNIIDAVRWVMGESAASHLRGDSMEDVIFNGSAGRKPVGQASVELVFDNSAGKLGGPWTQYNEIAVKRQVGRGEQSSYFINGTRCRRRDITAIFLGTGLGPRSYAIVEQGTISRVIESKPEELRTFFEEAAGISKYKERRRETANRIRHTKENLDRLGDLREELGKQLAHLQRQARNAEKYKEYRAEERRLKAELLVLRWRKLDVDASEQARLIRDQETAVEALLAEQRGRETRLTEERERQAMFGETLNQAQERHYQVGAEIARLEQTLEHQRQLKQRREQELMRAEQGLAQTDDQLATDRARLESLALAIDNGERDREEAQALLDAANERLADAEQAQSDWQIEWEAFNASAFDTQRTVDVERARIEQLERQQLSASQRQAKLSAGPVTSDDNPTLAIQTAQQLETANIELEQNQARLAELVERNEQLREDQTALEHAVNDARQRLQTDRGRLASLHTLQQAALGNDNDAEHQAAGGYADWLAGAGIGGVDSLPRLVERLDVEPGWERAVEVALGERLTALCVSGSELARLTEQLGERRPAAVAPAICDAGAAAPASGTDATTLLARLRQPPAAVGDWLAGIHTAPTLQAALALRPQLTPGASVITAEGVWLGRHWLSVSGEPAANADSDTGAGSVLARGREIEHLEQRVAETEARLAEQTERVAQARQELSVLERERADLQQLVNQQHRELARLESEFAAARERQARERERRQQIAAELAELDQQQAQSQQELAQARERLEQGIAVMDEQQGRRGQMEDRRRHGQQARRDCREAVEHARNELSRCNVALEAAKSERNAVEQALSRLGAQREQLSAQREQLLAEQSSARHDDDDAGQIQARLDQQLALRTETEQALTAAREQFSAQENLLRELEQARVTAEQELSQRREALAQRRLQSSETGVRRQTMLDQLAELGLSLEPVLEALPDEAAEPQWQERLEKVAQRIQRLGAINLAAIDEFEQLSERKTYLDAQNDDLIEALETLESAMARIDRETRARFKDTFDRVNNGLQALFPRLFGGGQAYLELTSNDALEAGVTIMARPPGKRNGTIHLLSGGEKALTAVAMIFSIFQLNPAPFCMLDEVDAPLDDANVGRFGDMLKEMSEQVQFIVVSHNKGTMEVAAHLAGVTMQEPGVSRLVAVDIDEAVKLAAV